ncbi:hypothetical protein GCM10023149_48680 [Mucilaginibacter gynuensis]|uniref:GED domain-containing protein n=1 Tax=Mucilaginibacter gynuensis TaxID=1302236 RepID=A0ABP8HFY7_9SPHI
MNGLPRSRKISLADITADNLAYFCKTQVIDKIRMERMRKHWSQRLADEMEANVRHYFVVLEDRSYDVISGVLFERKLVELFADIDEDVDELLKQMPGIVDDLVDESYTKMTTKAKACIDHLIAKVS